MIAKLHEIRGRREKVIIFARLRSMQAILAKVLQAEFQLPVRIINGETKIMRAAGSLKTFIRYVEDTQRGAILSGHSEQTRV